LTFNELCNVMGVTALWCLTDPITQNCKSGRGFRVGLGSGLILSNVLHPFRGCIQNFYITFGATIFSFVTYICFVHRGDFCEWSDLILLQFLFANTAVSFCSLLGFVSLSFWEGNCGEEISMRWRCFEKINHLHDSWFVLRNDGLHTGFSCL